MAEDQPPEVVSKAQPPKKKAKRTTEASGLPWEQEEKYSSALEARLEPYVGGRWLAAGATVLWSCNI